MGGITPRGEGPAHGRDGLDGGGGLGVSCPVGPGDRRNAPPPHPATVVVERTPHPATVQRREAPSGEPAARPPHPATVVQRREAPLGGATALPPHPATVVQRWEAPHPATVAQTSSRPPHPAIVAQRQARDPLHRPGAVQRSSSSSSAAAAAAKQPTEKDLTNWKQSAADILGPIKAAAKSPPPSGSPRLPSPAADAKTVSTRLEQVFKHGLLWGGDRALLSLDHGLSSDATSVNLQPLYANLVLGTSGPHLDGIVGAMAGDAAKGPLNVVVEKYQEGDLWWFDYRDTITAEDQHTHIKSIVEYRAARSIMLVMPLDGLEGNIVNYKDASLVANAQAMAPRASKDDKEIEAGFGVMVKMIHDKLVVVKSNFPAERAKSLEKTAAYALRSHEYNFPHSVAPAGLTYALVPSTTLSLPALDTTGVRFRKSATGDTEMTGTLFPNNVAFPATNSFLKDVKGTKVIPLGTRRRVMTKARAPDLAEALSVTIDVPDYEAALLPLLKTLISEGKKGVMLHIVRLH